MEFKGTKGKWESSRQKGVPGHCYQAQVFVDGISMACIEPTDQEEEASANALLISKAPEMLEMLKEANKVIEWYMENAKPDNNHTDFFNIGMNQRTQIEELIQSATTI